MDQPLCLALWVAPRRACSTQPDARVRAEPEWQLLRHAHIAELPALQWKLHNLTKLRKNADKFRRQHDELAARLERAR